MSHVLIAEAGTQGFGLSISQAVELDDVQILDSGANGLIAYNFSETGSNVSVIGAGGTAVVLGAAAAITNFPRGGVFKDNKINVAQIALASATYDDDVTFHDIGIPYLQTQEMKLINATMRMEPGVDYRIVADTGLRLGQIGHDQTLEFLGTAEAPVIFQGENGDASPKDFWLGLVVDARVKVNSILSNVIIRHAGLRDSDALDIQSPITVDHLTLEDNAGGLNIGSEGLASDSVAIAIRDGGGIPLRTTVTGLIRLGELGDIFSFSKNADQRVQVDGGSATVSGTVPNWGLPYFLPASIDVRGGARWVIAPGVEFQMGFNTEIALDTQQPTLQAIGTQASPIRFLGAEGPGSWRGLSINATAASAIDWVEIRDAGLDTGACLTLSKALPITHSEFSDCLGYGIKKSSGDTTDYLLTNTFDNMELGEIAP